MWTLKYKDIEKSFPEWGLSKLKKTCVNQSADSVYFEASGCALDGEDLFEPESSVTIYKNKEPWFQGIVTKTPSMGSSKEEKKGYILKGPWWYLENLVFQQDWKEAESHDSETLITTQKGRIILGQKMDGTPLSCKEQIEEIISYAISAGAPIQLGKIDINHEIPYDEVKDVSCAEALQRVLRWAPDAVSWVDYTQDIPAIHIQKRASLKSADVSLNKGDVTQIRISPRHDLKSPSVVLKYEKTHNYNGNHFTTTEVDSYPQGATGKEFKAMLLTIEMVGAQASTIRQKIKTDRIEPNSPSWWKEHVEDLAGIPLESIQIENAKRTSEMPGMLVQGSISEWMRTGAEVDTVTANISYTAEDLSVQDQPIQLKIIATDAPSKTFTHITGFNPGMPTPVGLAKALYEAVSELHYEGEISIFGEDAPALGNVLNLQGEQKAWGHMRALIQKTVEDAETGICKIIFGPPKHLGPADLISLLRMNRKRLFPKSAPIRTSGKQPGPLDLDQPLYTPIRTGGLGIGKMKRLQIRSQNSSIELDADHLPENTQIAIFDDFTYGTESLGKRYMLASKQRPL